MLYVRPDFYDDFVCIADKCRHSCCLGWEIDIDPDTAEFYKDLPGELGEELREKICYEPTPHFELTGDERCPFLNERGLCRLILGFGEDVLCDICREHPRFYNEFDQRQEMGLGLCCEEAARLLLAKDSPLTLMYEADEEGESQKPGLLSIRDDLLKILADTDTPMAGRTSDCLGLLHVSEEPFQPLYWRDFYLKLERMDESWTEALELIDAEPCELPGDMAHTRLFQYLVYRNFTPAESVEEAKLRFLFCLLSMRLMAKLEMKGMELTEAVRLYSSEIEYSDENIELILEKLGEDKDY